MVMRIFQLFLTKQILLVVQDLWQVHYEMLSILSQKELLKLNLKIAIIFLNTKV